MGQYCTRFELRIGTVRHYCFSIQTVLRSLSAIVRLHGDLS